MWNGSGACLFNDGFETVSASQGGGLLFFVAFEVILFLSNHDTTSPEFIFLMCSYWMFEYTTVNTNEPFFVLSYVSCLHIAGCRLYNEE